MRDLLGGKGANLAEMTRVLGANRVPAGFTITTEACVAYMGAEREMPEGLDAQVDEALARLERSAGRALEDPDDPLLTERKGGRSADARRGGAVAARLAHNLEVAYAPRSVPGLLPCMESSTEARRCRFSRKGSRK